MDQYQQLFDEAAKKENRARNNGKASGFISGFTVTIWGSIIWVGGSFFVTDPSPDASAIEEVILPSFYGLLALGILLFLIFFYNSIFSKEDTVSLEKIKNEGIREIVTTSYEQNYYKYLTAGVGCAVIIFCTTFYFGWHGLYNIGSRLWDTSVLFHVYRGIHIVFSFVLLYYLRREDKKEGYSTDWYTETGRARPKI